MLLARMGMKTVLFALLNFLTFLEVNNARVQPFFFFLKKNIKIFFELHLHYQQPPQYLSAPLCQFIVNCHMFDAT